MSDYLGRLAARATLPTGDLLRPHVAAVFEPSALIAGPTNADEQARADQVAENLDNPRKRPPTHDPAPVLAAQASRPALPHIHQPSAPFDIASHAPAVPPSQPFRPWPLDDVVHPSAAVERPTNLPDTWEAFQPITSQAGARKPDQATTAIHQQATARLQPQLRAVLAEPNIASVSNTATLPLRAAPVAPIAHAQPTVERAESHPHADVITALAADLPTTERVSLRAAPVAPIAHAQPTVERAESHPHADLITALAADLPTTKRTSLRAAPTAPIAPAAPIVVAPAGPVAPTIRVTIGRIEVRAHTPTARPTARPTTEQRGPALSLDSYLKQRSGEKR